MPVRVKITMSPEEYLRHMKEVEAATVKTAATMQDKFRDVGTSINKAGIATRFVSSEMGALGVAIGRVFQVAGGGKLAIAVAAIAAAFTGLKKVIADTTVSEEEYSSKLDFGTKTEEKRLDALRKTETEEKSMFERLQELAKIEDKTNEEQLEAVRLTQILKGRYSDLGLEVNTATGEFADLEKAMKAVNEAQKQQKLDAMAGIIANEQIKTNALARNNLKGGTVDQALDWVGGLFGKEGGKDWYNGYAGLSTADKLKFAQKWTQDVANTEEDIRVWSDIAESLQKQLDLEEQMNTLRAKGVETDKEENEVLKRNSEESRKAKQAQEEADAAAVAELEKYAQEQEEIDRKHGEALQRQLEQEKKITDGIKQRRFDQIANLKLSAMRATGNTEEAAIRSA